MSLKTLLIDNYDSYTYNLFQLIAEVNGELPTVVRNDELEWPDLLQRIQAGEWHNIVISPGPGTPEREADVGLGLRLLRAQLPVPTLGVCLGFQALAVAHGGRVTHAPEPVHGRLSCVSHSGHALFAGIPSGPGYAVVRYHSLLVEEVGLPACLQPIAWTCGQHHALRLGKDSPAPANGGAANGGGGSPGRLLMGLAHRSLPHWGVQFHPESVATGYGPALLRNFAALTAQHHGLPPPPLPPPLQARLAGPPGRELPPRDWAMQAGNLRLHHRRLPGTLTACGGSEALFWHLFGGSGTSTASDTFWLDSATPDRARFSFMGGRGGSLWRRIEFRLPPPTPAGAAACPSNGAGARQRQAGAAAEARQGGGAERGTLVVTAADGGQETLRTDFFGWLEGLLHRHRCRVSPEDAATLPFNFWGGLVGCLGYELKAECGGARRHASPTPDAAFMLADQLLALDHAEDDVYVLALAEAGSAASEQEAHRWVEATAARVQALADSGGAALPAAVRGAAEQPPSGQQRQQHAPVEPFRLREGHGRYLKNVARCMQALHDGESYEVCLTTQLSRTLAPDPAALYSKLRAANPAPYAAWLRLGDGALQLCCCSPERFLRGGRGGTLEAKPIKGTAPRCSDPVRDAAAAAALAGSEKDRAENLMIADLLRNDLGRVCVPGSVHAAALMAVESYATVHQLVSTVRGLRRPAASIVDCLRACFPGGSMTGAPKLRTMEIIDGLEGGARGAYSGCLGYISFNDTFDLNIVIRTAVILPGQDGAPDSLTIGAGGAIVVQSDPEGEFDEMLLKARALLRAVGECDGCGGPAQVEHS